MPKKPAKTAAQRAAERKIIVDFLTAQLAWLDRQCLDYSRSPDVADLRIMGQYEYFKNFRSGVRHLIAIANSRGMKQRKPT